MRIRSLIVWVVVAACAVAPSLARAAADAILGVETATGISEVLTPSAAGALIGSGGLPTSTIATSEAEPVKFYGQGAQASNGWRIGQGSDGNPFLDCYIGGVPGACDYYRKLNAGKHGGFKDSSGNIDFEYTESTGKISAMTVDCEDSGVNCTLYQKLPGCGGELVAVDATGAASHVWMKAIGATVPTATAELGTNSGRGVATFPDVDGDYGYEFGCVLHPGWGGQLDARLIVDSTGSGNFVANIFTKCYASDAAKDAAWNTGSAYTFTLGTASEPNIYTATNIIATGCAGQNILRGKLIRNRANANDTASAAIKVERFEFWGRTTY